MQLTNALLLLLPFLGSFADIFVQGDPNNKITAQEAQALVKLRPLVAEYLYQDYMKEDSYLVRFLRAKDLNVKNAAEMLLKSVVWRKKNRIDSIVDETLEVEKGMPYTLGSVDRQLRPVSVLRIGKWKLRRLVLSGHVDDAFRAICKIIELNAQKVIASNTIDGEKNITSAYIILDLNGFNAQDHACLSCTPLALQLFTVYESYYPQGAHKIIGVNVPRLFESLWTILKPAMSQATLKIFVLYGYNKDEWRSALRKDIADNQLPVYLGGTYKENQSL